MNISGTQVIEIINSLESVIKHLLEEKVNYVLLLSKTVNKIKHINVETDKLNYILLKIIDKIMSLQ